MDFGAASGMGTSILRTVARPSGRAAACLTVEGTGSLMARHAIYLVPGGGEDRVTPFPVCD